jgi:hypothetical protein
MFPLSTQQLDQFQANLRAALIAGVPITGEAGGAILDELSLERLGRQLRTRVSGEGLTEEALRDAAPVLPSRYHAAVEVWARTGDIQLVFEAFSNERRSARIASMPLRAIAFYLTAVFFAGYLGLAAFTFATAPKIDALREDLTLLPATLWGESTKVTPMLKVALAVIPVVAVVGLALFAWAGGFTAIVSKIGGRRYRNGTETLMLGQVAQALMRRGASRRDAVELAARLVTGQSRVAEKSLWALQEPRKHRESRGADVSLGEVTSRAHLTAAHALWTLRVTVPIGLVVVVGAAITIVFVAAMFWPVIDLYRDLVPETDWWAGQP